MSARWCMKTVGTMPVVVLMLLPVCGIGLAPFDQLSAGKEEVNKVKAKRIPLESIHSTSEQKGLKAIEPGLAALDKLYQRSVDVGASNVFLARGGAVTAAVHATARVFTAGYPVEEPVPPDQRTK